MSSLTTKGAGEEEDSSRTNDEIKDSSETKNFFHWRGHGGENRGKGLMKENRTRGEGHKVRTRWVCKEMEGMWGPMAATGGNSTRGQKMKKGQKNKERRVHARGDSQIPKTQVGKGTDLVTTER